MASFRNYAAALLVLIVGASVVPKFFLDFPESGKETLLSAVILPVSKRQPVAAHAALAPTEWLPSPGSAWHPDPDYTPAADQIRWISMADALSLNTKKRDKKPIFIDLYTDWCGWCKRMDATTFQDPVLVKYLNEHYHCVRFNAETHGPLNYLGHELSLPSSPRATHPFALMVGAVGGSIGYPTVVLLDADSKKLQTLPGFQTPQALEPVLVYYAEGYYLEFEYATFQGMYTPKSGQ